MFLYHVQTDSKLALRDNIEVDYYNPLLVNVISCQWTQGEDSVELQILSAEEQETQIITGTFIEMTRGAFNEKYSVTIDAMENAINEAVRNKIINKKTTDLVDHVVKITKAVQDFRNARTVEDLKTNLTIILGLDTGSV